MHPMHPMHGCVALDIRAARRGWLREDNSRGALGQMGRKGTCTPSFGQFALSKTGGAVGSGARWPCARQVAGHGRFGTASTKGT